MTQARVRVADPRIGSGLGLIWSGVALGVLGLFALAASAGGSTDAGAFGVVATPGAASLIAIGFWVRLAHKIELRLIDIQRATLGPLVEAPSEEERASTAFLG